MKNLPRSIKLYICILSSLVAVVLYNSYRLVDINWMIIKPVLFFIIVAIIADLLSVDLPRGGKLTVNFVIHLACIVLFGPDIAVWVALFGELLSKETITGKNPFYKTIFNMSQFILSVWSAGQIYFFLGGKIDSQPVSSIIPFIGATFVYFLINFSAVTTVLALANKSSIWGMWLMNFRGIAPNFLAFTPLSLLMAAMYKLTGILGGVLFFLPLFLARYVFQSYLEIRQVYLDTLGALASALDAKDKYTKGHSDRVAAYAVEIARTLGLSEYRIEVIEHMALLHDIGKIGISEEILTKPGRLSNQEFEQIKQHPVIGANILKDIKDFESSTDLIKYHHEKFDGTGYPYGLKGEEIPLEARIITLADSFDAMTSDRAYRKAMNVQEAFEEIRRSSGNHFDPVVVEAFINSWHTGGLCETTFNTEVAAKSLEASE